MKLPIMPGVPSKHIKGVSDWQPTDQVSILNIVKK